MSSKAVAPPEAPPVPALAPTPATTLTAEDIAVPRLYVANYMSQAFKHSRAAFGDVYLATSADDEDPEVLWSIGSDDPGVLAHVLFLRKGKSYAPQGGQLDSWDFDDPNAHPDAHTTYQYTLILPEVDAEMPARLLLTKSGTPVARRINTVLARNAGIGPMHNNAFRITSAKRQKDQNEWAIFQAAVAQADPAHVKQADALYGQLAPGFEQQAARRASVDEPEI